MTTRTTTCNPRFGFRPSRRAMQSTLCLCNGRELVWITSVIGMSITLSSCSPAISSSDAKASQPATGSQRSTTAGDIAAEPTGSPRYACDSPDHDFGNVWVGTGPLTHAFTIRNDGDSVLKVLKVKTGCGCTQAGDFNRALGPGESTSIPISLDASRLRTKFHKTITLTLNDPESPTAELSLMGSPRRYIELDPPTITFGQSKVDSPLTKRMTISNQTEQPMVLELIDDATAWGNFAAQLVEKEPGKVFELIVRGVPPYDWNINRGTFRIKTNIPQQPELAPYATVDVPPRIRVSPPKVEFRKASNVPLTRRVMFSNNGEAPVEVLSAVIDDPAISCTLQKRTDGKEYQVNLVFPAGYMPPTAGRTLTIHTTDTEFAEIEVPLLRWVKPKNAVDNSKASPPADDNSVDEPDDG